MNKLEDDVWMFHQGNTITRCMCILFIMASQQQSTGSKVSSTTFEAEHSLFQLFNFSNTLRFDHFTNSSAFYSILLQSPSRLKKWISYDDLLLVKGQRMSRLEPKMLKMALHGKAQCNLTSFHILLQKSKKRSCLWWWRLWSRLLTTWKGYAYFTASY